MNRTFSGKFKNYKKDDLRALALALKVSDLGNKDELNKRINKHFEDHPADKEIPRFASLFQPSTRCEHREATPQPPTVHSQIRHEHHEVTPQSNGSEHPYYYPHHHFGPFQYFSHSYYNTPSTTTQAMTSTPQASTSTSNSSNSNPINFNTLHYNTHRTTSTTSNHYYNTQAKAFFKLFGDIHARSAKLRAGHIP